MISACWYKCTVNTWITINVLQPVSKTTAIRKKTFVSSPLILHCFDTVVRVTGRASGLQRIWHQQSWKVLLWRPVGPGLTWSNICEVRQWNWNQKSSNLYSLWLALTKWTHFCSCKYSADADLTAQHRQQSCNMVVHNFWCLLSVYIHAKTPMTDLDNVWVWARRHAIRWTPVHIHVIATRAGGHCSFT